jgi:hypothetical protein|tara:strand:- start:1619 stop:2140 length:522 start_codon:yes stop_codon:yes gene_type:complete
MESKTYNVTSTSIIETRKLGIPKEYKQKCIDELHRLCIDNYKFTNVKALRTEGYFLWKQSKIFNQLFSNIINHYTQYFSTIETNDTVLQNLSLKNAWGIIYNEGHYTKKHNHSFFYYSFVYYLSVEKNNSPLIFENTTKIYPEEDTLILFPGYLNHEVKPNKNKKIAISGNIS